MSEEGVGIALVTAGARGHLDRVVVWALMTKTMDDGVIQGGAGGMRMMTFMSSLGRGMTLLPCAGITWGR